MFRNISFLVGFCLLLSVAVAGAGNPDKEKAAVVAAEKWLDLICNSALLPCGSPAFGDASRSGLKNQEYLPTPAEAGFT